MTSSYEFEIPIETDDIQYGVFGVCTTYSLILLAENNVLKLYDNINKLHEINFDSNLHGAINNILWCESKNVFFILSWWRLHTLSIEKYKIGYRTTFRLNRPNVIDPVKAIDYRIYWRRRETKNQLRFITIQSCDYLFLNRGYHTLERWKLQSWDHPRIWNAAALGYKNPDDKIKLITCSDNGDHLAINVELRENCCYTIDFRRTDAKLTILKRISLPNSSDLFHKLDLSVLCTERNLSISTEWLIIDEVNSLCVIGINKKA